jgi:hypothetical protein
MNTIDMNENLNKIAHTIADSEYRHSIIYSHVKCIYYLANSTLNFIRLVGVLPIQTRQLCLKYAIDTVAIIEKCIDRILCQYSTSLHIQFSCRELFKPIILIKDECKNKISQYNNPISLFSLSSRTFIDYCIDNDECINRMYMPKTLQHTYNSWIYINRKYIYILNMGNMNVGNLERALSIDVPLSTRLVCLLVKWIETAILVGAYSER